jgi:hypothetical protein
MQYPTRRSVPVTVRLAPLAAALCLASAARAQLVTPKTVPVRQGEQFGIFPSARAGMAGVRIALDDTLADPFVNPARAMRVGTPVVFGAPFFHDVSAGGGGRTVPVGAMGSGARWGGAGTVAFQQLDRAGPTWNLATSERTALNRYAAGALARTVGEGLAVGVGAFAASLDAVDGVDLLYAGSDRITQSGSLIDLRLGATRRWRDGRVIDLLVLHNRTDVTHDVHFTTFTWDALGRTTQRAERDEHNVDRTNVWGAHGQYAQPIGREGWRLGAAASVNRLSHPKIPNYAIMNIPRDPGTTWAYDLGAGAARTLDNGSTVGIDVIYEPMWSTTWADAARDTTGPTGNVLLRGQHTVDNRFRFANMKVRLGLARERALTPERPAAWGYQLGLALNAIEYRLWQTDHVRRSARTQDEHWMEWTPTFALRYRSRAFTFAYDFRLTCGPGGECLPVASGDDVTVAQPAPGGVIAAPSRPLDFNAGASITNRFTVSVPLR